MMIWNANYYRVIAEFDIDEHLVTQWKKLLINTKISKSGEMCMKAKEILNSFGNSHFIGSFIKYYADMIIKNKEHTKCLIKAPNYYAWLGASSEYIYYKIRTFLSLKHDDPEFFNKSYLEITNKLVSENKISKNGKDAIYLFLKIRHLIVHKGFPNLHEKPAQSKHKISHEVLFNKKEAQELCNQIKSPSEFENLQEKFRFAIDALLRLQADIPHKDFYDDLGMFGIHLNQSEPNQIYER